MAGNSLKKRLPSADAFRGSAGSNQPGNMDPLTTPKTAEATLEESFLETAMCADADLPERMDVDFSEVHEAAMRISDSGNRSDQAG